MGVEPEVVGRQFGRATVRIEGLLRVAFPLEYRPERLVPIWFVGISTQGFTVFDYRLAELPVIGKGAGLRIVRESTLQPLLVDFLP